MLQSLVDTLFGCAHSHTTFPMTPGRTGNAAPAKNATHLGTYVVCLDCGKEFAYDWGAMRIGRRIAPQVTSAPQPAIPPASVAEAQPVYR